MKSNETARKPVIGLIGGIGSGKSFVAEELARRGGFVISGDRLGHAALREPEIHQEVVRRFGTEIVAADGTIDRRQLGTQVFADSAQRRALEEIVHPWIGRRIEEEIDKAGAAADAAFIVLDAAILLEAGWSEVCDRIVFVDAPRDVRLRRLDEQRGWDAKEIEAREAAQMSMTEKKKRADFVVDNSGSAEQTARQVENLLRQVI